MHKQRFIPNALPASDPPSASKLHAMFEKGLPELLATEQAAHRSMVDFTGGSVYVGMSGLALTLWHVAQHGASSPPTTTQALLRDARAMAEPCTSDPRWQPHRSRVTFLEGRAGPLALMAVLEYQADRNGSGWRQQVARLLALHTQAVAKLPAAECEVLYGRAGYLWALLWVRSHIPQQGHDQEPIIPPDVITQLVRDILSQGRKEAAALGVPGLMYQWHDSLYLGAAHGVAGVLYVLLHCMDVVTALDAGQAPNAAPHRQAVLAAVQALVAARFASGNLPSSLGNDSDRLVQWCHGAPGLLQLLAAAVQALPEHAPTWLAAIRESAEVVWQRGLLTKGVGLCHGISGNAYSLLSAARALRAGGDVEGAAQQLHRTQQMALFAYEHWREMYPRPNRPASLYEGLGGLVCLISDLATPDPVTTARFPGFEL